MRVSRVIVAVVSGIAAASCSLHRERTLAGVESGIREKFAEVRQVSTDELSAWLADQGRERPVLVDVRARREFEVSHLPGAMQINPERDAAAQLAAVPKDRAVVMYCSVGYRSSRAARQLMRAGYANVANLEGSIFAWANEGRPVERDGRRVTEVHPYNEDWGRLLRPEVRAKVD